MVNITDLHKSCWVFIITTVVIIFFMFQARYFKEQDIDGMLKPFHFIHSSFNYKKKKQKLMTRAES